MAQTVVYKCSKQYSCHLLWRQTTDHSARTSVNCLLQRITTDYSFTNTRRCACVRKWLWNITIRPITHYAICPQCCEYRCFLAHAPYGAYVATTPEYDQYAFSMSSIRDDFPKCHIVDPRIFTSATPPKSLHTAPGSTAKTLPRASLSLCHASYPARSNTWLLTVRTARNS